MLAKQVWSCHHQRSCLMMLLVTYSRKECQKTGVDQGPSVSNCINPSLKSSIPPQSQFCEQIAPSSPNKNTSTMCTFAPRDGDHRVLFSMTKMIPRKKPKYSAPHTLRQSEYSKLASVFWSPGEIRVAFKVFSKRYYYSKGTHWEERWKYIFTWLGVLLQYLTKGYYQHLKWVFKPDYSR